LHLKFRPDGPVEDSFATFDDLHFHLIAIGQPALLEGTLGAVDLLCIHAIPDDPANDAELARAGIPRPSFYLVRPDGHVGLCGVRLEAADVGRYLSEHMRLAA
jgi:hypothetical protein